MHLTTLELTDMWWSNC